MFICDSCLKKNYTNKPSAMDGYSRSMGPCEDCGEHAACNDIHHSQLKLKPKPRAKKRKKARR